ncbi:MAG: 30S ribosomal protein S18 [Endomicrobium sp.]|nr:30S ribosomal protein S18 [Endomicrobium sp.]
MCRFCADKIVADYKNVSLLRTFITENGKIFSGHITGTCASHQRELDTAIKRARMLALLSFTTTSS